MQLGRTIRARRKEHGWSVETLAKKAKVSPRQLYRLEANETKGPGLDFLKKIAGALGVEISELMG